MQSLPRWLQLQQLLCRVPPSYVYQQHESRTLSSLTCCNVQAMSIDSTLSFVAVVAFVVVVVACIAVPFPHYAYCYLSHSLSTFSNFSKNPKSKGKVLGNVTMVVDGYSSPVTAGNFIDLALR